MRVLIPGASGFVGRWLTTALQAAGDEVVELAADVDVREFDSVADAVTRHQPDAIAHLAAVAFAPDAGGDPGTAFSVAIRGTANVMEAARLARHPPVVLVAGSSEVYGAPAPEDLPLNEGAILRTHTAYGLAKLAQESVALSYARRYRLRTVVTRSFNHIGPGQRTEFVVPALARRVYEAVQSGAGQIAVGNVNVLRDFSDVRDVTRAYRLLLGYIQERALAPSASVVNVCSGKAVSIRSIAETFCRLAGANLRLEEDPDLVRPDEPAEIRGDYTLLATLTGWRPTIGLEASLSSVWEATAASARPIGGQ